MEILKDITKLTKRNFKKYISLGSLITGLFLAGCNEKPNQPPITQEPLKPLIGAQGRIIFTEYNRETGYPSYDIWIANPDGTNIKKLIDGKQIGIYPRIRFSPKGDLITFKGRDDNHKIIDLDGNILHEFKGRLYSEQDFVWSPDGRFVIFAGYVDGIYRYDLQSRNSVMIVDTKCYCYDHNPAISPDLEKIVFTHHEYGSKYYIYSTDVIAENLELIIGGEDTWHDEDLNLEWVDKDNIIFKVAPKNTIYYFNIKTKQSKEATYDIDLDHRKYDRDHSSISLSNDRRTLALFGLYGDKLYFVDIAKILSGKNDFDSLDNVAAYNVAWSGNDEYLVVSASHIIDYVYTNDSLRLFNRSGKEYKFISKRDMPESITEFADVDWSTN